MRKVRKRLKVLCRDMRKRTDVKLLSRRDQNSTCIGQDGGTELALTREYASKSRSGEPSANTSSPVNRVFLRRYSVELSLYASLSS